MKKIILLVLVTAFFAGFAYAETTASSQSDRSVDELRDKIVRTRRDMDKLMKAVLDNYSDYTPGTSGIGDDVRVDIAETKTAYIVKADLPGMNKDKIEVTLSGGKMLKIAGSREAEKKTETPGVVKQERMYGKFERVIELPGEAMNEGITAAYNNGVLEIVIPKKKISQSEQVKIKVN